MHLAAWYGSAENIMALLDADADPANKDADGKSAWDLAKSRKRIQDTEAYQRLNPSGRVAPAGR